MVNGLKISFVIPSFNDPRILETIDSIRATNIPNENIEIIVQDGGSSEGLLKVIDANLMQTDKLISKVDYGIFDAINMGIAEASGYYILTLGSDDRVFDLDYQMLKSCAEKKVEVIIGAIQYTTEDWAPIRLWKSRKISLANYYFGRQYAHFGLICTKSVYYSVGYFNIRNKTNADYEFFYYLTKKIKRLKQLKSDDIIVQMRIGGNSSRNLRAILKANLNILRFILKTDILLLPGFFFKFLHKINEYIAVKRS